MRKTEKERADLRRQTEERRQADKDRNGHSGARGMKKPSMAALSHDMLNEDEARDLMAHINEQSDRGLALMAGALVEMGLYWAVYRRFPDAGEEARKATFISDRAPLGTFSAKIIVGRQMLIYGDQMEKCLNSVRAIRNAFAHALRPLDFNHPTIVAECEKLTVFDYIGPKTENLSMKDYFALVCQLLYHLLITNANQYEGSGTKSNLP